MSDETELVAIPPDVLALDLGEFYLFCNALEIETKEKGLIKLGETFLGSQLYFFEQIAAGLAAGIHYFVILKGRQLGISTACLALDLYWHFKYPGTQGTLATDTEDNREMFRSTLTMYMESLPHEWRQPVEVHNRVQLVLSNRSRISYQVAGTRKNVGFGAGKAVMFVHATEVGKWGDGTDLSSFEASLAETNPLRLYIWESTAYGFNKFQEMWETAEQALTQRAIFIGWWRNELYSVPEGSEIYRVYWDGKHSEEERKWVTEVKALYDFDVTPGQIAWYRFTLEEKMKGDVEQMHEKYPPTADYAFIMTGSQFFNGERINDAFKRARMAPFSPYKFSFGGAFGDTELVDAKEATCTLKIWEPPVAHASYTIGADPAWGSSEWADRFAISVFRCWADQLEQVAEFCTEDMNTMQFAWVLIYLAGAYGDAALKSNVIINLEVNGPGMAVWSEIKMMRQSASLMKDQSHIAHLLMNLQNYLYSRPDAVNAGLAFHTKTTSAEKDRFMNLMKDYHEFGSLTINSAECVREMKNIVRVDGVLGAPGRGKDDRVIAAALADLAWHDTMRIRLIQAGLTRKIDADRAAKRADGGKADLTSGRSVVTYLKQLGVKNAEKMAQKAGR